MTEKRAARYVLIVLAVLMGTGPSDARQAAVLTAIAANGTEAPQILGGDSIPDFVVSPGAGGTPTQILDGATGGVLGAGFPFGPTFSAGIRMAAGDLTGDGIADLVMGMGPGGGLVSLLNGSTIASLGGGYPFGPGFGGGVSVAVGDVNGDGRNDIITAQASGGGTVTVFNGVNLSVILSATPFGAGYSGGLNVSTGDVDADGRADLLVGQASGGRVAVVSALTGAVIVSGDPFGPVNGVFVAAGDVNLDGRAEVIVAPGSGNGPVVVFDLRTLTVLASFSPYPVGFTGGVRVAASDLSGDGRAEIITVPGPGIAPVLHVFDGATFADSRSYPALPASFTAGAYIAVASSNAIRFTSAASAAVTVGTAVNVPVRASGVPPVNSLTVSGALPAGVTFSGGTAGNGGLTGTPAAGTGGTYALTFTAANGVSVPRTQAFTLTVNEAPAISSASATTLRVGVAASFTFTSTGFPRATVSLSGTLPTGVSFSPGTNGTGSLAGTPAVGTAGSYPVTVTASNGMGTAASQNFVITVQDGPRVISSNATTFRVGQAGSFSVTTVGSPAVTNITSSGALPTGVTLVYNGNGTATLAGTPGPGTGGDYPLTFTVQNGVDTGTQNFTLTVQQVPTFTSAASSTFAQGTPGAFAVTTTGFPAATLSVTGALPSGVSFTPGANGTATIAGTPTVGGSFPLTLQASNGVGAPVTQGFTLVVNAPPAFTSASSVAFGTSVAGSFSIVASGYPAATISLTGSLPSGVTFANNGNGTATLAGTPAAGTGGIYPLTLNATNGIGSPAAQNFTLTVQQPPAITSAASTTFNENQASSFTVVTTGFPGATVSATGTLPTGVTFTPNSNGTGTLAGTPASGTQGTYPLTISASNGVGSAATQNFTLTINGCPLITVSPAAGALPAATYGTAYSQGFTATGGSGHTFTVTSGAVPAGLSLSTGGALTGSPTTTGSFNFTVTATISGGCSGATSYSLAVSPNAHNDSYSGGVGNTQLSVGAGTPSTPAVVLAGTVLSNDSGPGTLTAGPANIASTNGGQVALSSNGTFLYTPAVGFAGPSDTFTYTLTDGNGATSTAVTTISLSGVVWYVNAAGAAGDGRSHSPANTMNAAAASAQTNQVIYVHAGAPTGATALKANQRLQGAGESFTLNGLTIAAGAAPTLHGTVTLADNVVVRALQVDGGAGPAIAGTGLSGTEALTSVSVVGGSAGLSLTNVGGTVTTTGGTIAGVASGAAVSVSGGGGAITVASPITATSGPSVDVQNRTSGVITFSGSISDSGAGISLQNNTGATIAFTGGLSLSTGANAAFVATGGGTVTATQNNTSIVNTITTTSGAALRVVNTLIGAAGLTFRSITADQGGYTAGVGITLDNTGTGVTDGGLTVTGNGTAESGGVIAGRSGPDGSTTSGIGIYLSNTRNVSLSWMALIDFTNAAIVGRNVYGFTLADTVMFGSMGTTVGELEGPIVFGTPSPGGINGLIGIGLLHNVRINGGVEHSVAFYGHSNSMALTVDGDTSLQCQIVANSALTGANGLHVEMDGTANSSVNVEGCRFIDIRAAGYRAIARDDAILTASAGRVEWVNGDQGLSGFVGTNAGNAHLTASVTDGFFSELTGASVLLGQDTGNATAQSMLRGTISNNQIYQGVGASDRAVVVAASSTAGQVAPSRVLISGNFVQSPVLEGIYVSSPVATATPAVDLTMDHNHVDILDEINGVRTVTVAALQGGAGTNFCANINANLLHHPGDAPGASLRLEQGGGATVRLERGAASLASTPLVVLQTNNPAQTFHQVSGTVSVVENATCLLPSAP